MNFGARMIRESDGMRGLVEMVGSELRIVYRDRGERIVAPKKEKWTEDAPPPTNLTKQERRIVALAADQVLRSFDLHKPLEWWKLDEGKATAHDTELVQLIEDYLETKRGK